MSIPTALHTQTPAIHVQHIVSPNPGSRLREVNKEKMKTH